MSRRLACAAVAVALSLCSAPVAGAQPAAQQLNSARTEFRAGNFNKVITLISSLLYPKNRLSDKAQIAEAHLLLGVSKFEMGDVAGADAEFEEALYLDRDLRMDPLVFSEKAIKAFEDKKKRVLEKIEADEAKAKLERDRLELEERIKNALVVEKRDYIVNFAPFGLGQFQNGQPKKGTALAITQAVLAGTSLSLWGYQVFNYGYRGKVPEDEVDTVNTIQVAQIGTAVGFFVVWGYGIVDSLSNYKPSVQRRVIDDPDLIKKLPEEKSTNEKPKKKKKSFRIVPTVVPGGAGVGAAWEF